jgi:type V secretory pathway adhesin AidA
VIADSDLVTDQASTPDSATLDTAGAADVPSSGTADRTGALWALDAVATGRQPGIASGHSTATAHTGQRGVRSACRGVYYSSIDYCGVNAYYLFIRA